MLRTFYAAIIVWMLAGCASLPAWLSDQRSSPKVDVGSGQYSFAWRLSGDKAVAPVQVFDNGRKMWLQFAEGGALPAIFERTSQGDRPLRYERDGHYVVVQGVWPRLVLRGGHLTSFVDRSIEGAGARTGAANIDASASDSVAPESSGPNVDAAGPAAPKAASAHLEATFTEASFAARSDSSAEASTSPAAAVPMPAQNFAIAPPDARTGDYDVSPADENLRVVLARWARIAGWTFEPEHWTVDADIPVSGSARFNSTFKVAVQNLVASTELADQPLQPCFYSNKVLRIVPYAQLCDRTKSLAERS